jgi:magnesium-transporting ATPase (P-type)
MIACRLTPAQKAKLVEESQLRAPDALTLAIGDGNNDEPMIRQANVGVGIAGKEGSAAARAADYAVPDFKSLHSLLLVHGVWNYHRMAVSIQYIFYKSTIMAAIAAIFAFYSAFSGEQYFNDLLVQLYGIVFTSVPIIAVGISDQALPREVLENQPGAYRSIRRGALFNVQSFVQWILLSCVHAIVVYFVPYFGLSQVVNHWEMSTISFSAICVVANLELLFLHTFVFLGFLSST